MAEKLTVLFHCMKRKDTSIIHLYKRQFRDGMQVRVQNDGEFSEPFEVTNGVIQGCVMAPTLFIRMFSVMLMNAFQDSDTGFTIRYCFDGNLFNL